MIFFHKGEKDNSNGHGSTSKKPVPPLNIRFNPTTKIGSKMGGEFTFQPKWDPIGCDPQNDPPMTPTEVDSNRFRGQACISFRDCWRVKGSALENRSSVGVQRETHSNHRRGFPDSNTDLGLSLKFCQLNIWTTNMHVGFIVFCCKPSL